MQSQLRIKTGLRHQLFDHLLGLGPVFTHEERTGELTQTVVEGVEALDAYFSQYLPQLVLAALVPLTFLAFVFPLDPLSGFILLFNSPAHPAFYGVDRQSGPNAYSPAVEVPRPDERLFLGRVTRSGDT